MRKDSVIIVSCARTPQGSLLGALKDVPAPRLGAAVIKAAVERAALLPSDIQEVIMGCVLSAGLGQAPARQAALDAHLPVHIPCSTINKICGSGMKAVMFAHDGILAGSQAIYVAGGMENMSRAPYLMPKGRQGHRLGHAELLDHMMFDGLEDAYEKGKPMGYFAELCAKEYNFTREKQDAFATTSLNRAQQAIREKLFVSEIVPVMLKTRGGEIIFGTDERPGSVNIEKIPTLSPAFDPEGTITAANSSSISDGAAALVLMRLDEVEKRNVKPLAHLVAHSSAAKEPQNFPTAPVDAIRLLLEKTKWTLDEIDLFEINEAFAVVTMAIMKELNIPHEKVNIHGGGCALGHPIGATGARIIVSLVSALKEHGLKKGIAALCIGGGEATAVAVEII